MSPPQEAPGPPSPLAAHGPATPACERASNHAIVTTDRLDRITTWNAGAERLFGLAAGQAIGLPFDSLRSERGGFLRPDGVEFAADCQEFPLEDERGSPTGCLRILRARPDLVANGADHSRIESRLRALVTASSDLVYRMNPDWSELVYLHGRNFLPGVSRARRDWLEAYIPEEDRDRVRHAIAESIRDRKPFELEHRVRRVGGSIGWAFSRAVPILDADGGILEWFGTASDITARKLAEAERERVVNESEHTRRIYEAALSNTPDLVYIFDLAHRFVYANEALLRMWGRTREDALGKNCLELGYEPWHAAMHDREIEQVVATRRPIRGEVPFTGTNGRRIYDYIFVPVLGPEGEVVAVAGTTRDVTDRHGAEERLRRSEEQLRISEERFRAFMDNSPATAWLTTIDGTIIYLSATYTRTFRLPEGGLLGRSIWELFPEPIARSYLANIQAAVTSGGPIEAIEEGIRVDGSAGRFLVYKFPLHDSEGVLVGGVAVDITERERAEAALRENDRRKNEFLAMLAHELRNPLAAISNAVRLSGKSDRPEDSEWARSVVESQVRNLARMVDDLLDISRITRGKIRIGKQPLDLARVLRNTVAAARPAIAERGHHFEVELPTGPIPMLGDATRLEQVASNLISNAIKYTEPGGTIRLALRPEGTRAIIEVSDSGIGMSPELIARAFELFAQGDRSPARSEGGLGIGLTLVKSLIEMHGGTVIAESDGPGQGSRFTVSLPIAAGLTLPTPDRPSPAKAAVGPLKILVVDDNVQTARGLSRLLKIEGHEVAMCHDGPTALSEADRQRPDVILLDIGLPGMDGYQVARRLRSDACCSSALIVATSGYGTESDRRQSRDAGFDDHLVKPIDFDRLLALIQKGRKNG